MVDLKSTAQEWGLARTDIIFFPVGAMEQHGNHLPVGTDCIQAEYFSRALAEHFDAALLPVQQVASSLEHGGWRGAFSLKPETLMAVVRDIADEAERQNYRIMVVVSGHGGNFPLGPVCREWNRQNRKLKIILIHPYDYGRSLLRQTRMDLHAGDSETSLMRYICGEEFPFTDKFPTGNLTDLVQPDLNTFGVGCLNPNGVPGHPEDADVEFGKKLASEMVSGSIAALEKRIALLKANPRYSGAGGLYMRRCTFEDIPELCGLVADVSWDQVAADCENFLKHGEIWSFVHLNRIVSCAAWVKRSEELAWIGMVITRPEWRGCSIATRLMKKLIERTSQYRFRALDASVMGAPIYRKLGFCDMYRVSRLSWQSAPRKAPQLEWVKFDKDAHALPGVDPADPLVGEFMSNAPELSYVGLRDGKICAWFTGRYGRTALHIGPLWAEDTSCAVDALNQAKAVTNGSPLTLDTLDYQREFRDYLTGNGAVLVRDFLRMGLPDMEFAPEGMYLDAGPEYG